MSFPLTGYPRFPPPHLCTSVNLVYSHQSRVNNISGITTIKKRTNFYTRFFAKVATGLVHYDRTEKRRVGMLESNTKKDNRQLVGCTILTRY